MKKIIKNRIFIFILGGIIFSTLSVGAVSLIYSKDVTYDNTLSGLKATTVQGALDELYESAKNGGGGASVNCNDNGECTVTCQFGNPTITNGGYSCANIEYVKCPNNGTFIQTDNGYKCINLPINETTTVMSGNGLYTDNAKENRYFYKGGNVNNYITFNEEMWRIISIEGDGTLKIIRNEQISAKKAWDNAKNRNAQTDTYCINSNSYACNAWAATKNLVNTPSTFLQYFPNGNTSDSTNYSGKVTINASLNAYLNGTYYNSIEESSKKYIVKGIFNVSTPGNKEDKESLETNSKQEKQYQWNGYVALYTMSELLRASTNSNCKSLNTSTISNGYCNSNNWLWPTFNTTGCEWTLSPAVAQGNHLVWRISGNKTYEDYAYYGEGSDGGIRPVVFLSKDVKLKGTGTPTDPYQLSGQ